MLYLICLPYTSVNVKMNFSDHPLFALEKLAGKDFAYASINSSYNLFYLLSVLKNRTQVKPDQRSF